jgi:hypothetical protein
MMLKRVGIQAAGSGAPVQGHLMVNPDTTARQLLNQAQLNGFLLCPSPNELPFGEDEPVFDQVGNGSLLFAYREATAGAQAPAYYPATLLNRRGWKRDGFWSYGYYRTRVGSFAGKVRHRLLSCADYFIKDPPEAIEHGAHWACFTPRGGGWYSLHFNDPPKSVEDGIKSIERLLAEALLSSDYSGGMF